MNRDKDVYGPDADKFHPERFLFQSEKGAEFALRAEYENDDGHCSYGFGRRYIRLCPFLILLDDGLIISESVWVDTSLTMLYSLIYVQYCGHYVLNLQFLRTLRLGEDHRKIY